LKRALLTSEPKRSAQDLPLPHRQTHTDDSNPGKSCDAEGSELISPVLPGVVATRSISLSLDLRHSTTMTRREWNTQPARQLANPVLPLANSFPSPGAHATNTFLCTGHCTSRRGPKSWVSFLCDSFSLPCSHIVRRPGNNGGIHLPAQTLKRQAAQTRIE
jgi:hypothetical protein